MSRNNLPAPLAGTEVAAKVEVTRAIGEGIKALQVAFPLVAQTAEDRKIAMGLYAGAVQGFPDGVAEFALRWLCFNNPRNTPTFTQPPTPQDVRECCEHVQKTWKVRTQGYFASERDKEWGTPEKTNCGQKPLPWGPEPMTFGCHIPNELVIRFMRELTRNRYANESFAKHPKIFDRLSAEFFEPGRQEELRQEIAVLRSGSTHQV